MNQMGIEAKLPIRPGISVIDTIFQMKPRNPELEEGAKI
jgi:hypothetical protein